MWPSLPAISSAAAVVAVGIFTQAFFEFGPLSTHMAVHIALMNAAAPLVAAGLVRLGVSKPPQPWSIWTAAGLQMLALWGWHAPLAQRAMVDSASFQLLMHATLFATALWFWSALLRIAATSRWQAIGVLLLTGKLACLLGGLLIFAPRVLYDGPSMHLHAGLNSLDDQQLAGLLMVTACPLSYVVAGVVFAAQWMAELERASSIIRIPKQIVVP